MNLKKYRFFILLFLISTFAYLLGRYWNRENQSNTSIDLQVISQNSVICEKKIQENTNKYKIRIYYPYTSYQVLNQEIEKWITNEVETFKKEIDPNIISPLQYYTLDIRYDMYSYKNYISYVFYTFLDTKGAHPNTYIHTISFDKNSNQLITISSLKEKNNKILGILSNESRIQLQNNKTLQGDQNETIDNMILEGTTPTLENFQNFAFSKDGLIIFFENYQVAPYVYGSFQVTIPYQKLEIDV